MQTRNASINDIVLAEGQRLVSKDHQDLSVLHDGTFAEVHNRIQ